MISLVSIMCQEDSMEKALTLFEEGEAIPPIWRGGGGKFVLHPKKTKSSEKKW